MKFGGNFLYEVKVKLRGLLVVDVVGIGVLGLEEFVCGWVFLIFYE